MNQKRCCAVIVAWLMGAGLAQAGEAVVEAAVAHREAGGTWRFDVTVRHADEGWKHYANRWVVIGPDGTVPGTRVLAHPQENAQPFT